MIARSRDTATKQSRTTATETAHLQSEAFLWVLRSGVSIAPTGLAGVRPGFLESTGRHWGDTLHALRSS
jgi:hypothetical protein